MTKLIDYKCILCMTLYVTSYNAVSHKAMYISVSVCQDPDYFNFVRQDADLFIVEHHMFAADLFFGILTESALPILLPNCSTKYLFFNVDSR